MIDNNFIPEMPIYFSRLGLQLSLFCNLKCRHCSQDGLDRQITMSQDLIEHFLTEAAVIGCKRIGITGGEPFLTPNLLKTATDLCFENDMECTVVTNAWWAKDDNTTYNQLEFFKGISGISISWDPWHAEYVSVDRPRRLINTAKALGKKVVVCSSYLDNEEKMMQWVNETLGKNTTNGTELKSQTIVLRGAAKKNFDKNYLYHYPIWESRCMAANIPLLVPNGTLYACCGAAQDIGGQHFLNIGNLKKETLIEIKEKAENNLPIHIVRYEGPGFLLKNVGCKDVVDPPSSACDLCISICKNSSINSSIERINFDSKLERKIAAKRIIFENDINPMLRFNSKKIN